MKEIKSINFIKFFSFLSIFLLHTNNIIDLKINSLSRFGVEIFIVLSGFLMYYNYYDKFDNTGEKIPFFLKKLKKFYPLFIISLLIKLPVTLYKYYLEFNGLNFLFFTNSVLRLIPSLFLFQAFIPSEKYYFAYNGVAWFLDVLFFCYLFTPFLVGQLKKIKNKILASVIVFLIQCFYILILNKYQINEYWYYIFPLSRIFDYIQGMLLCSIYLHLKKCKQNMKPYIYIYIQ